MNIHRRSTANSARAGPAVRGAAPLGVSLGAACSAGVGLAPVSVEAVDCGTLAGGSYVSSTTWSTAAPLDEEGKKEGRARLVWPERPTRASGRFCTTTSCGVLSSPVSERRRRGGSVPVLDAL